MGRLYKPLENTDEVQPGDADARVAHPELGEHSVAASPQLDVSSGWCELQRVREQIAEHLAYLLRISPHVKVRLHPSGPDVGSHPCSVRANTVDRLADQ